MEDLWSPLLVPGRIVLLHGDRATMRGFHHELVHHAIHASPRTVLWCDAEHGFNPYAFAELNLERGHEADAGADRLLVKRCMTPFQWDTVLTKHLDQKLVEVEASMVLAAPYEALFSTDETRDWEQEDYVAYSLRHLAALAKRHDVPVVLSVDMARWWRTHPALAQATYEAAAARWTIDLPGGRWRARRDGSDEVVDPGLVHTVTLFDFAEAPVPLQVAASRNRRPRRPTLEHFGKTRG